jgi:hypothetical protein
MYNVTMSDFEEETKVDGELPQNSCHILTPLRYFSTNALLLVTLYKLKLPKTYNSHSSHILATECNSKDPNLYLCIRAIEKGADPNIIIGPELTRPLHAVVRRAKVLLVRYLVEAGADINALNGRNQTPLIVATDTQRTDYNYMSVIHYLSHHRSIKLNLSDVGGNTALLNAIYRNNVWITRYLFSNIKSLI